MKKRIHPGLAGFAARPHLRKVLIVAGASLVTGIFAVSAVRLTAEAMDSRLLVPAPLGTVTTGDGIVSGMLRVIGGELSVFSGDRFESTDKELAIHFESGGSVNLCPRSRMQMVAQQGGNLMFAFDRGGSRQAFPFHQGDVMMTPDWRVELAGNVNPGDTGLIQVALDHRGALCVGGQMQSNSNLQVTELAGTRVFHIESGQNRRFSENGMEEVSSCGCPDAITPADAAGGTTSGVVMGNSPASEPSPALAAGTATPRTPVTAMLEYPPHAATPAPASAPVPEQAAESATQPKKKHAEDVAGYVGAFFHKLFGR